MKRTITAAAFLLAGPAVAGDFNHTAWAYGGSHGPENWGQLRPEYSECNGEQQSPINIRTQRTLNSNLSNIRFDWDDSPLQVKNIGYTIELPYKRGSIIKVNRTKYQLQQYHFHAPSEHAFDGKLYDMEVHFVHQARNGEIAVIAVFFEEGEENPTLQTIWNKLPPVGKTARVDATTVNAKELLPKDTSKYFHYKGSLTTPPCSEVVNWYVLATPIEASKEQIRTFSKLIKPNNRPIQPLNRRFVLAHE